MTGAPDIPACTRRTFEVHCGVLRHSPTDRLERPTLREQVCLRSGLERRRRTTLPREKFRSARSNRSAFKVFDQNALPLAGKSNVSSSVRFMSGASKSCTPVAWS